jgi:hypothetical protein
VIFIEQNFGPPMEQKCFTSAGPAPFRDAGLAPRLAIAVSARTRYYPQPVGNRNSPGWRSEIPAAARDHFIALRVV